jgi:hypothetical protein
VFSLHLEFFQTLCFVFSNLKIGIFAPAFIVTGRTKVSISILL